jgi:hypothetical protein
MPYWLVITGPDDERGRNALRQSQIRTLLNPEAQNGLKISETRARKDSLEPRGRI